MSVGARRVIWRFIIFALMGLLLEVFSGAFSGLVRGNWNMRGNTSPWMMLDYGLFAFALMPIAGPLKKAGIPLPFRAVVYMAAIFAVEFVSGWLFDCCGLEIWDYSHMPYNLYGYIALGFIPPWYALGLAAEFLYRRVDACALVLALRLTAEQIEPST